MPKRARVIGPAEAVTRIHALLDRFEEVLPSGDLRASVLSLVPVVHELRALGCSLIPRAEATSARPRILAYMRRYPGVKISGDELYVVAGISEWARRVRELRVQEGWRIVSGLTLRDMQEQGEAPGFEDVALTTDDYLLVYPEQDRDAAHRWHLANSIRREKTAVKDRILKYLLANIGIPVTGEELMYVAKNASEWARRTRELRDENGWSVTTKSSGRPDLPVGVYVLESARQAPEHDRRIPELVRRAVLVRDHHACRNCTWDRAKWTPDDPRHLELHHLKHHKKGGDNTEDNLVTLCNVCHDGVHAGRISLPE